MRGAPAGSANWLAGTEGKYGGKVGVGCRSISHRTPILSEKIEITQLAGGDRMSQRHHGYAKVYQSFLEPYVVQRNNAFTICEIGILQGTGLAIWCDLFPNSRIIGLDLELSYFNENYDRLRQLGAYSRNLPEVHQFDQYNNRNTEYLQNLLDGDKVDVCIDDGIHTNEAILTTLKCMSPHLSEKFVYFIEDNKDVHREIALVHELFNVQFYDIGNGLTVLTKN